MKFKTLKTLPEFLVLDSLKPILSSYVRLQRVMFLHAAAANGKVNK